MRSEPRERSRQHPARVQRLIASIIADDPSVQIVYVAAVRPDSYFRSLENGQTVVYVHPSHRPIVEPLRPLG